MMITAEEAHALSDMGSWKIAVSSKIKEAANAGLYKLRINQELRPLIYEHIDELRSFRF